MGVTEVYQKQDDTEVHQGTITGFYTQSQATYKHQHTPASHKLHFKQEHEAWELAVTWARACVCVWGGGARGHVCVGGAQLWFRRGLEGGRAFRIPSCGLKVCWGAASRCVGVTTTPPSSAPHHDSSAFSPSS